MTDRSLVAVSYPVDAEFVQINTSILGGVQLIVLGVMGQYIGSIHEEVKRRPLYVIGELENFPDERPLPPRAVVADRRVREYER